jgi:hypothetical protein
MGGGDGERHLRYGIVATPDRGPGRRARPAGRAPHHAFCLLSLPGMNGDQGFARIGSLVL